jgi:hypothetical protein
MERPEGIEPFDSFHLFNVARLEVLWWNRAYKIKTCSLEQAICGTVEINQMTYHYCIKQGFSIKYYKLQICSFLNKMIAVKPL